MINENATQTTASVSKRREKKRGKRDLGKNSLKRPKFSMMRLLFLSAVLVSFFAASFAASEDDEESAPRLYTINGKVHPPAVHNSVPADPDWFWRTKVVVDGGKRRERIDIMSSSNTRLQSISNLLCPLCQFFQERLPARGRHVRRLRASHRFLRCRGRQCRLLLRARTSRYQLQGENEGQEGQQRAAYTGKAMLLFSYV